MRSSGSYVLMLVYVDNDWKDIAGNVYPKKGPIEAQTFTNDIDISKGLYGILWGKTDKLIYEKIKKGHWLVVKTDIAENFILVDKRFNKFKFKRGVVVHAGTIKSAAKYIISKRKKRREKLLKEAELLKPKEIAGSKKWLKNIKSKISV